MGKAKNIWNKLFSSDAENNKFSPMESYTNQRFDKKSKIICHAPFTGLYFGHFGNVHPCCANRDFTLGKISQHTIHEIWNGENLNSLRESIKTEDFSKGCQSCERNIKSYSFETVKAGQYDIYSTELDYPQILEFELSNKCNLHCIMCSGDFSSEIRKSEKLIPYSTDYNENFIQQLDEYLQHIKEAVFYGGEPFLIKEYYKIWEKIKELNPECIIRLQTNGTILNDKIKNLLEKTEFHICISTESFNKDIYEKIRVNADFDKFQENFSWFHDYCKRKGTFFGISVCPLRENILEIPQMIEYCDSLKIPVYFHTVNQPPASALWLCNPLFLDNANRILSAYKPDNNSTNIDVYNQLKHSIQKFHKNAQIKEEKEKTQKNGDSTQLLQLLKQNLYSKFHEDQKSAIMYSSKMMVILTQFENSPHFLWLLRNLANLPKNMMTQYFISQPESRIIYQLSAYIRIEKE